MDNGFIHSLYTISPISDFGTKSTYMILNERACIGEPIGLLIFPSACTFTLSGRCARVKKVRVCVVYTYHTHTHTRARARAHAHTYIDIRRQRTLSSRLEYIFYYCSNLPSNEKRSSHEHHRKKSFPVIS